MGLLVFLKNITKMSIIKDDQLTMGDTQPPRINSSFHNLRFILLTLSGVAMGLMMILRLSISIAIVSMVNHTHIFLDEHPNATDQDLVDFFGPDYVEAGEFNWDHGIQGEIMMLYMVTYTIFPVFVTRLIMKYGLRISIVACLSICAITNILTPTMAYWGWAWVVGLRLLNGAAASGVIPGMVSLIESWTSPKETANGVVIYQFTGNIIAVATPLIAGQLALFRWDLVFYVPGAFSLLFCIIWWLLVADEPKKSKLISQKELELITSESSHRESRKTVSKPDVEWYFMFKIGNFYYLAIIWCLYCATSGSLVVFLPTYLHRVMRVSIGEIGTFTFIVQLGSLFSMLWPNPVAEFLMSRFNLSLTAARRWVVFMCIFMSNVTLVHLAVYHQFLVFDISIQRFFHMTHDTVFLATVMSQFGPSGTSGLVYSMLNSLGCMSSTVFSISIGKFLDYTGESLECWSWIFGAMAIMNLIYLLIYTLFCSSEPVFVKNRKISKTGDVSINGLD